MLEISILLKLLRYLNNNSYKTVDNIINHINMNKFYIIKNINKLKYEYLIDIEYNHKYGYKLIDKIELLNAKFIIDNLDIYEYKIKLDYFFSIQSTNDYLMNDHSTKQQYSYHICLAEHQSKGKGRFNSVWISPFGKNLYLSLKTFLNKDYNISGISLALAVEISKVLNSIFPTINCKIKWPNDIYIQDRKVSGLLIETKKQNDMMIIIIGIGININMSYTNNLYIDKPFISLKTVLNNHINRNTLTVHIINAILFTIKIFKIKTFKYFMKDYNNLDYLVNKRINVIINNKSFYGIAKGVNKYGELIFYCNKKKKNKFLSNAKIAFIYK